MSDLLSKLAGNKTYLLVIVAAVLVIFGVADPNQVGLGLDQFDGQRVLDTLYTLMIATVRAGIAKIGK